MLFYFMLENIKIMDWIDVNDRLPNDDDYVLVFDTEYNSVSEVIYNSKYFNQKGFWLNENGGEYEHEYKNVTHWMPLPEPPK